MFQYKVLKSMASTELVGSAVGHFHFLICLK